jgi:hypothetical protein
MSESETSSASAFKGVTRKTMATIESMKITSFMTLAFGDVEISVATDETKNDAFCVIVTQKCYQQRDNENKNKLLLICFSEIKL